ncbi:ABC transporter substrate-binding protein [Brevibacillus choshinensis]|uniref:Solute-binding protein family 5 domain-containing protein n=1 Tax=Brevibacillus choshinensis TaxID=54911 RepID=A0ABX7FKY5_BRECH|nr:ABC transporter substrate-binding protein [Brevibacillus choshinensis]QRG66797.1 hypothetical protein JNE38_25485 [Brevibacillus choshinensis]
MNKKRQWMNKGFIFIFVLALLITGCTSQTSKPAEGGSNSVQSQEKVLKIASFGDFETADPHFNTITTADEVVRESIYNGLVRFKPGSTKAEDIEADLAEKWENNKEGTIWTFHLRKGVKWHQGYGDFTSADVKWSYERVMNPETASPASLHTRSIAKIETPDDYTVVFHLKQADPTFLLRLVANGNGPGKIVKKEAVEAAGKDYKFKPVGTGPFIFKEHRIREKVVLEKNPDYFRGEPKLNHVEIYAMKEQPTVDVAMDKGDIHMTIGIGDELWMNNRRKNKDVVLDYSRHPLFWFLHLNTSMKPYDDIRVRKAIAHAINSKGFVEQVMGLDLAKVPTSTITSNLFGHADIGIYEYNPELSKKLLAEAGYPNGITLPQNNASSSPTSLNKMTWVQEQLRTSGIELPMTVVDSNTNSANNRKNLNGLILQGFPARPHADFLLTPYFHGASIIGKPTGYANLAHYEKSDALIDQARVEMDPEKAKSIYVQIQQQIKDEYVMVPLAETYIPLVRRKEVQLGYDMTAIPTTIYLVTENTDLVP